MWASELDNGAMEGGDPIWWIILSFKTYEQSGACTSLSWWRNATMMHCDDKPGGGSAMVEIVWKLTFVTFLTVYMVSSILSSLHSDIQFWNSRQSLEGLSVRSIIFGVFQSLVVLLYILDNETNFVVQVSVFIGLLIDFWKITKVMDVRVSSSNHAFSFSRCILYCKIRTLYSDLLLWSFQLDRENKIVGIFPRLVFKDKSTYVESSTKIYDDVSVLSTEAFCLDCSFS